MSDDGYKRLAVSVIELAINDYGPVVSCGSYPAGR